MRRFALILAFCLPLLWVSQAQAETGGNEGSIPQLVLLYYQDGGQEHFCTGTVVGPTTVLTAGHCGSGVASTYQLYMGTGQAPTSMLSTPPLLEYSAQSVTVDPSYNPATQLDDVAVITLAQPTKIRPIQLTAPQDGEQGMSYGWGGPNGGVTPSQNPVSISLGSTISSPSIESTALPPVIVSTSQFLGAGPGLEHGDSGGPLIVNGVEVGINDARDFANMSLPSVYVNIGAVQAWIDQQIPTPPAPVKPIKLRRRQLRKLGSGLLDGARHL